MQKKHNISFVIKRIIVRIIAIVLFVSSIPLVGGKMIRAADYQGLANPRVGGTKREMVEFGTYRQEDTNGDGFVNTQDKKTPIRWQILEKDGSKLLLIADKILSCYAYNSSGSVNYEKSSLRKWLNETFYDDAFSKGEKGIIKDSAIREWKEKDSKTGVEITCSVKDHVSLLSITDIGKYGFSSDYSYNDPARQAEPTLYAKGKSTKRENSRQWWLRSDKEATEHSYVDEDGHVYQNSYSVNNIIGIRPVIRVDISSSPQYVKSGGIKIVSVKTVVWDTVKFGKYNGQDLTWRVLNVNGDDAFVLSDISLEKNKYNNTDGYTWEWSTIRSWLNNDFLNSAFNNDEKAMIKDSNVINSDNHRTFSIEEKDTVDKIYLLSISEISNIDYGFHGIYYCNSNTRIAKDMSGNQEYKWWLRSYTSYVDYMGRVCEDGVLNEDNGIRPVMHINLSSSAWTRGKKVTYGNVSEPEYVPAVTTDSTPTVQETIKTGTKFNSGGLKYKITKSDNGKYEVSVIKVSNKKAKSITIKGTVKYKNNKCKVTGIGKKFASGCKKLKTITIKSKSIKNIDKNAFAGIKSKYKIKAPKSLKKKFEKMGSVKNRVEY